MMNYQHCRRRCPTAIPQTLTLLLLLILSIIISYSPCHARRGALVRDGMSSKQAYDNPLMGKSGDITIDPDVVAITTRCAKWSLDPINCIDNNDSMKEEERNIINNVISTEMRDKPIHITFRSKTLQGGKRPNWMRATAFLGNPAIKNKLTGNRSAATPLRAVWTCSNADADTSMTYEESNTSNNGRITRREIGVNVLEDGYEDCLKRLYGKYVELEVLLPRTKKMSSNSRGNAPPSVVYRVPIQSGHVNPLGMTSKSRATVTLYPHGRTLAAEKASGPNAASVQRDVAIPLGLSNVHVPLGPGLVDPSWVKGRKLFWKGRSVGLV